MSGILSEIETVTTRSLHQLRDRVGELERRAADVGKRITEQEKASAALDTEIEGKAARVKKLDAEIASALSQIKSAEQVSLGKIQERAGKVDERHEELDGKLAANAKAIASAQAEQAKVRGRAADISAGLQRSRQALDKAIDEAVKALAPYL